MLPDKHFEDIESSKKRRQSMRNILISAVAIISLLLIGPLIHELSHIVTLEFINCSYIMDIDFKVLGGIYAEVQPLCYPSKEVLAVFYSSGYLSTLVTGWGLVVVGHRIEGSYYRYVAAAGVGMLLSILLSIGQKGDVENFLTTIGVNPGLGTAVSLVTLMVVLAVSFSGVKMLMEA